VPTIKIGRRTVAAIQKPERPALYWDEDLPGFGVLAQPSGNKTWIVQYRAGAGGRGAATRRVTLGSVNDAMPAEKARDTAKTMLAKVRLGADPAAERAEERKAGTVKEIMDAWLRRHVDPKRKGSTAALYRQIIDTHVIPALGTKRALAVTKQEVARLHEAVATKERKKRKAEAKPRASRETSRGGTYVANRVLALLSAAFNWAADVGLLPDGHRNPALGIEKFREQARERFLTSEEFARLGTALHEAETAGIPWEIDVSKPNAKHIPKRHRATVLAPHVVAAFRLLIFTGARLREILNLRWTDVDLERGALFLSDSKTGRKTVLLAAPAVEILESLPRAGSFVIVSETAGTAKQRPRHDLKRPWALVTRRAGLTGLRIHDLRHSFASVAVGGGVGLPLLGGLLGHADVKTTARYAHLANDPLRRAANATAGTIASAMYSDGKLVVLKSQRRRA
jgi:integrase